MLDIIKKMFGDKATKDLKVLQPYVERVHNVEKEIGALTNDQLRAKTQEFKKRIHDYIDADEQEIVELKNKIETTLDISINEKESKTL